MGANQIARNARTGIKQEISDMNNGLKLNKK